MKATAGAMDSRPHVFVALNQAHIDMLFSLELLRRLEALADVTYMSGDTLPADLGSSHDIVITGWGTPLIERLDGGRLKLAVHSAGGFKTCISQGAIDQGLQVSQAGSDAMAKAVGECAFALTLMMLRELHTYDRGMRASRDFVGVQTNPLLSTSIFDQSHGLVGLSRTGKWHARLLTGFGVTDVVAFDPYATEAEASDLGVRLVSLDEAMARNVVALHAPVTAETRRMIGAKELALMPDGALLVNTARSAIVDMEALLAEVSSGRLRAAIDVFDEEPLPSDHPLHGLPNVVLTPHVAGGTTQARQNMGAAVIGEIERFLTGQPLLHLVSPETISYLS